MIVSLAYRREITSVLSSLGCSSELDIYFEKRIKNPLEGSSALFIASSDSKDRKSLHDIHTGYRIQDQFKLYSVVSMEQGVRKACRSSSTETLVKSGGLYSERLLLQRRSSGPGGTQGQPFSCG